MPTEVISIKGKWTTHQRLIDSGKVIYCGRRLYMGGWTLMTSRWANPFKNVDPADSVLQYYLYVQGIIPYRGPMKGIARPEDIRKFAPLELRNQTLACWCQNNGMEPCHCDVLVYFAEGTVNPSLVSALQSALRKVNDSLQLRCAEDPLLHTILLNVIEKKYHLLESRDDGAYHAAYHGEIVILKDFPCVHSMLI